jgi:AraC-like DNA-binding protein
MIWIIRFILYDDVSAFRKVFLKTTGLSPALYRRKFGTPPTAESPMDAQGKGGGAGYDG